jgi:hypothetical protein
MNEAVKRITPRHYQALCGLSLAGIVLLQLQQSTLATHITLLVSVLIGFIGWRAIVYRTRISPMLVQMVFALPSAVGQYTLNQTMGADAQSPRVFEVADVLMCVAALAYFIGHYRLNGLWHGVLPPDARVAAPVAGAQPGPPRVRSEESLSVAELATLVFAVPAFAVLAQLALLMLQHRWPVLESMPRARPLLLAAWTLVLGMFLVGLVFRYWQRLQMDRVSAMLLLQDILWHDTRGEQRRVSRWIAWKRLRSK